MSLPSVCRSLCPFYAVNEYSATGWKHGYFHVDYPPPSSDDAGVAMNKPDRSILRTGRAHVAVAPCTPAANERRLLLAVLAITERA